MKFSNMVFLQYFKIHISFENFCPSKFKENKRNVRKDNCYRTSASTVKVNSTYMKNKV